MALINCPECGKEVSDMAKRCPNCGMPIMNQNTISNINAAVPEKKKKIGILKGLSITSLIFGIMFLLMVLTSKSGIDGNERMAGAAWFMLWQGILGLIGIRKKGFAIVAIVFYFVGALYNLVMSVQCSSNIILSVVSLVFGIVLINKVVRKNHIRTIP